MKIQSQVFQAGLVGEKELALMQAVNQGLSFLLQNEDTEYVLERAFQVVCEAMECDGMYLFDYTHIETDKIISRVCFGLQRQEGGWRQMEKETIAFPLETDTVRQRVGAMMQHGTTTVARTEDTPAALRRLLEKMDVGSYLSFRIVMDGKIWGGISFVSRSQDTDWANNRREFLLPFVSNLGNFLERKRAERALREQQDYLRQIIDSSPNPIYAKNERGAFTLVNKAMATLHRTTPAEMEGKSIFEFHPDTAAMEKARQEDVQIIKDGKPRLDMLREVPSPSGKKRYVQISKVPIIRKNGGEAEIFTTITDITDIKKTKDRLQEERNFSESITSTIPDWILLVDFENRRFTYHNLSFPILGFRENEVSSLFDLLVGRLHPEDRGQSEKFTQRLERFTGEEIAEKHFRLQHKDGRWVHFYERAKVFSRHPDGRLKEYLAVVQDVTANVESQQRLAASEQRYRDFIEYSYDGIYYIEFEQPIPTHLPMEVQLERYYRDGFISECNKAFARMYGRESPAELVGWRTREIHFSEYFESNRASVQRFFENGYKSVNTETIEYRKSGEPIYLINHAIGNAENGLLCGIWGTQQDITERRLAEDALKRSEQRYRNFIRYSYDGIYYLKFEQPIPLDIPDEEQVDMYYQYGYIEECNAAFARMYGVDDPGELVGLRVYDAHKGAYFEQNRRATLEFVQSNFQVANSESREPGANGEILYLLNHAIGDIKDGKVWGVWGTQQDITERRKAEQALRESQRILQGIVNALPDLKFRINRAGIFLDYYESENENETPLVPPLEFIGKRLSEVLPEHISEIGLQAIQQALQHKDIQLFEYTLPTENELLHYEGRVSPISDDEVIMAVRNISESKRAKNELQKKLEELDEKNQELRQYIESNFQLENFAYIASHDLREPVRNMHNFAQILQRNYSAQLDEKGQRHLQFMMDSALRMNALIEDLLEYSRISSEEVQYEQIELERLLNVIAGDIHQLIRHKEAEIFIGQMPETIRGSRTQIKQLFQNLLTNAIKFHREGVPPVIRLQCIRHDDHWLFEVRDNGLGIPLEKQEEVFQLFKRLHKTRDTQGTGIGLAICQRIVEHHQGKIWVESEPNSGSAFYFTIRKEPMR